MGAVWMQAASELRARWRGALVVAVLFGLAGSIAMTAASGARRTSTSYERLLAASAGYHVEVQPTGSDPESDAEMLDLVAALPQVADHGRLAFVPSTRATAEPQPFGWDVTSVAMVDHNIGRTLEIPRLLDGRRPDYANPHEAAASADFLAERGLSIGDRFSLQLATFPDVQLLFEGRPGIPQGPVVTVEIVGAWKLPHDVSIQEQTGILFLTPAFYERYAGSIAMLPALILRLRDPVRETDDFVAGVRRIGDEAALTIESEADLLGRVDRALGVQATALWILGGAVAIGALLVVGQALGRWLMLGAGDDPTLRALGMGTALLIVTRTLQAVAIGLAAAAIAIGSAVLLSPLVPIGLGREIDPELGFIADAPILAIGALAIVLACAARGAAQVSLSGRVAQSEEMRTRPTAVASRLAGAGLPPAVVTGVRFATEPGRGKSAVPIRSVLAGATMSIVALVGAFAFGRNMDHMLRTPSTYGFNWDLVVFGGDDPTFTTGLERSLSESDHVEGLSRVTIATTSLLGSDIDTMAVETIKGRVLPSIIEGRPPTGDDEVALASKTLRAAGLEIGDSARFPGSEETCGAASGCTVMFRIVGRVAFWGEGTDPDTGAAFSESGQRRISRSDGFIDYLVTVPADDDKKEAVAALEDELDIDATLAESPVNIDNIVRVRGMPTVLAAILGLLALATVSHALITAAQRRRHDLAVLKTLGFVRRQVRATAAWHSTTTVVIALLVGLPAGLAVGRWAWMYLADRLGVVPVTVAPIGEVAVGAAGVIVLANVVALIPARVAARSRPAEILRTE